MGNKLQVQFHIRLSSIFLTSSGQLQKKSLFTLPGCGGTAHHGIII